MYSKVIEVSFQITLKGSRVRLQLHPAPDVCQSVPKSTRDNHDEQKQKLLTVTELCTFNEPDQRSQGECVCVLGNFIARAETKFKKCASDKISLPGGQSSCLQSVDNVGQHSVRWYSLFHYCFDRQSVAVPSALDSKKENPAWVTHQFRSASTLVLLAGCVLSLLR